MYIKCMVNNSPSCSPCRAAQRLELQSVQAYSNAEGQQGLHTLPTAIVDYRGIRLSAQGLAPGLEGADQDQGASPASRCAHVSLMHHGSSANAGTDTSVCLSVLQRPAVWGKCWTPGVAPAKAATRTLGSCCQVSLSAETRCSGGQQSPCPTLHLSRRSGTFGG